ncbi:hypothetical protein VPH35_123460 [Triticum aestivum]
MSPSTYPLEDENVNPTANWKLSAPAPAKKSWIPAGFGGSGKHDATIDIPLYDPKKREQELLSWEEDLKRRERDIIQRENAMNRAGVTIEVKNWPPFFPVIHHDIANEIPTHAHQLQYLAFASWLGIVVCLSWNVVAVLVESIHGEGACWVLCYCCNCSADNIHGENSYGNSCGYRGFKHGYVCRGTLSNWICIVHGRISYKHLGA